MQTSKRKFTHFFSAFNLFVVLTVILSLTFSACSSQDEDITLEDNYQQQLMDELNEYSETFVNTHTTARGDLGWSKFKEALKADHSGFSNGSWLGSFGESFAKWQKLKKQEEEQQLIDENPHEQTENEQNKNNSLSPQQKNNILIQIDSLVAVYRNDNVNIGALHNAVILKTILDDKYDFDSTEEMVISLMAAVNSLGVEIPEVNITDVVKEIDDFFENIYDDNVFIIYERLTKKFPERADEFKIQCQYLSTIDNLTSDEDIQKFAEGYSMIVQKSKISTNEKLELVSNLSIAPASHQLWMCVDSIK